MRSTDPTVFVVDDDRQARDSVCALVRSMGIHAQSFGSAEEFLAAYTRGQTGCLVIDVRMLGMSGLELQEKLNEDGVFLPVIVITAYAKTPLTVEVMQKGAVTLLDKPYEQDDLWQAIRKALQLEAAGRRALEHHKEIRNRMATLTPKQREVLDRVVAGKANKMIAQELDVSVRTVENRRREVFAKMQAESVAQLVRLVVQSESPSQPATAPDSDSPAGQWGAQDVR